MFDFGNANDGQRQAISTTEGPVLITAGPGTGKTYTLVQRAIYLIEERGVKPEDIFIATFTEKAAKELITRITNELASRNITVNVNEMYVGTFHSLCLRIIKDHLEYTRLKKNYRLLDTFDQQYLVFRNIYKFRTISGIENVMPKGGAWKWAQAICEFSNNLTEEVVDIDAMLSDHDMEISVIAKVVNTYQAMLDEENLMDFSAIQTECYRLLKENKDILEDLRNSIKYIMVDEYQDTNYIQEQTIFLLGTHENICVVGDDDQGLYRFRGATIRNILEFPSKFDVGKCQIIPLVINYRSDSDIVEFYNKWMITTSGSKFKFEWDKFRYDKRIVANETSKIESPCVVKLASKDDEDEWHERVLDFINRLKNSGKIQDYNQLAFLFSSVKHERVISLARFLESNHINVYSPRSDMFFRREEVMQALGCMMLMFPNYVKGLENGEYKFLDNTHYFYFRDCIKAANEFVTKPENLELKRFIRAHGKGHATLAANSSGTTDYTYSGLLYRLFMYKPFSDIGNTTSDATSFEEKQYGDIWTNDEYLQFMYERLMILRELMSDTASIFVHCDWHKVHHLRCLMDEIFGSNMFLNEIVWQRTRAAHSDATYFGKVHDTILVYKKGGQAKFNPLYTEHSEAYLKRFTKEENGRKYMLVPLHGPGQGVARNFFGKIIAPPAGRCWPVQSKIDELIAQNRVELTSNGTPSKKSYLDENNGNPVSDWWDDIVPLNPVASERTDYPTQKPEQLLERIVEAATNRGDLVFDCFMGSGTTQSVAMKLGRRFIGADINLGAIQTTTKRLINVASELDGQLQEEIKYTGFEVYNVNNYDFFRNPIEAKNLIIEALEVQPFTQGNVWDGELDGRMVKIMPVNRIATKADLEELKANLPYKTYEKRKEENPRQPVELITIICMGHEPDLKASLEQSLSEYKVDVQIVDILRDKSELQLKREAEAEVVREGNKLVIRSFYPMNLMQKLSLQKEYVEDWKQLVESIMIDWNYDGVVMQPMVTDVPDKKEFVAGIYDIPEDAGTIKVKITDLLSESLEVEV